MKEQIQKDKRVNSRFLTALLVAEAALRPIANDWAHLDEGKGNSTTSSDACTPSTTCKDRQERMKTISTNNYRLLMRCARAVVEIPHDKNNLRLLNLQRQAKILLRNEERKLLHTGGGGYGFQSHRVRRWTIFSAMP